jgi:hypothetical protein
MNSSRTRISSLRLIKWCSQWRKKDEWTRVPVGLRGIYVLHKHEKPDRFNVVYVGMAASGTGIKRRLRAHSRAKRKAKKWTHFSFFVAWENIRDDEIRELEALLQEIYRKDLSANALAKQKGSEKVKEIRKQKASDWSSMR